MRRVVPEERSLESRLSDGPEPLCSFLNKPVPDVPFPKVNEREEFEKTIRRIMEKEVTRGTAFLTRRVTPGLVAVLLAWVVFQLHQKRDWIMQT